MAPDEGSVDLVDFETFTALAEYALARARRDGEFVSLVCFKIGGLRKTHDEDAGDASLAELGDLIRRELRASDVVARAADHEIVVLLAQSDTEQTANVIRNLAATLRERNRRSVYAFRPLARIGAATFDPAAPSTDCASLMDDAHAMLASSNAVLV